MERIREEFEAWCENDIGFTPIRSNDHDGYSYIGTNDMWNAWQASRAALCVELPMVYPDQFNEDAYFAPATRNALDAAGVSYK